MAQWKTYDNIMQRWNIPFDHIEDNWTYSQFLSLLAACEQNDKRAQGKSGMSLRELTMRNIAKRK